MGPNLCTIYQNALIKQEKTFPGYYKLPLGEDASYEEQPIRIIEMKDRVLRGRVIPLVRIQWNHHNIGESTWEDEGEARKSYPHLFPE